MSLIKKLDLKIARAWREYNFSTIGPETFHDAAQIYLKTRKFDYLELAKRGFMHEIERLYVPVIKGLLNGSDREQYRKFIMTVDTYDLLRKVGALSWMEQEKAFTVLLVGIYSLKKFKISKSQKEEINDYSNKVIIDFKQQDQTIKKSGYQIHDGEVIVFDGDSLTGGYGPIPRAIELFPDELEKLHRIAYPERKVLFINLAKGGDTISGGINRAERIALFNPDKVILCFGGNGIIDDKFAQDYPDLINKINNSIPKAEIMILSVPYSDDNLPLSQKGNYAEEIFKKKHKIIEKTISSIPNKPENLTFINIQNPIINTLKKGKTAHSDFTLHEPLDGVHLYDGGGTLVALYLLKKMGGKLPFDQ